MSDDLEEEEDEEPERDEPVCPFLQEGGVLRPPPRGGDRSELRGAPRKRVSRGREPCPLQARAGDLRLPQEFEGHASEGGAKAPRKRRFDGSSRTAQRDAQRVSRAE